MTRSPLSFAVAIAQRRHGERLAKIFAECGVAVQYIGLGHGTASSEIMDYLGLDEPEKDVVLGLALTESIPETFSRLGEEMGFMGRGTGVAFSLPVSSATAATAERAGLTEQHERSDAPMEERFELIITVVDANMTEVAMDAARAAGARGGTVMKCRDMSPDGTRRVFGVTVHSDKEVLLLVTPRKDKEKIMQAVCAVILKETEQQATAFSIPIDDAVGLR
jgi:hypothetical protein